MAMRYLVTGATGNLGSVIVKKLVKSGKNVRALVMPSEIESHHLPSSVEVVCGDVRNYTDLRTFFDIPDNDQAVVIHCAGIVTIYPEFDKTTYDVNVGGTRNIVMLCVERKVKKLVYVSSVHAIPPLPKGQVIHEIKDFDPDKITGFYGKTKAEASRIVMEAVRDCGLDASIVFPSGLCGPEDTTGGHVTQLLIDCANEKLPAGINGGYDFADTRDVANGVISAAERGGKGEGYILSNRYVSIKEIMKRVHEATGAKLVKYMCPVSLARLFVPILELYYKSKKRKPLFTEYSLYTLTSNAKFSSAKARKELGYKPRPFGKTVVDTLRWLRVEKKVKV